MQLVRCLFLRVWHARYSAPLHRKRGDASSSRRIEYPDGSVHRHVHEQGAQKCNAEMRRIYTFTSFDITRYLIVNVEMQAVQGAASMSMGVYIDVHEQGARKCNAEMRRIYTFT